MCIAVNRSSGSKGRKLKVLTAAAESAMPAASESIFNVMLSGPRPIVTILVVWTDAARWHLASVLRRILQEGFQVAGLKLHVTSTAVKRTLDSDVRIMALQILLLIFISAVNLQQ